MKAVLINSIKASIFLLIFFAPLSHLLAQSDNTSLGLKVTSRYENELGLFALKRQPVFAVDGYVPGSISYFYDRIKWEIELKSTEEPVMIRQTLMDDVDIRSPLVLPFHEFVLVVQKQEMRNYWQKYTTENFLDNQLAERGAGGINLEIPVKITNKTFQKIFGSGTVGLVVTGDIRIQAGLRREDRSEVKTALAQGSNTNFKMQQTQRFSVTGKIGDKVKVNVDQDSERPFDFDNNVRLVYEGYEDEIVKKFEAGNISLSLPGTKYVTFSGKNSGLFGLKTELELGSLNITAIASQEKGESQKLSLSGGSSSGKTKILDYNYLKNTYFFLDFFYREQYRQFTEAGDHVADPNREVISDSLVLYKAAPNNETRYPDRYIVGRATIDGQPANESEVQPGSIAEGSFVALERGTDYILHAEQGWVRLNTPVSDNEVLAVSYVTQDGERFGDINFVRDTTGTQVINLKLIRDINPLPTYEVYDLEWKHVYSLGSRNIEEEGFEVKMFLDGASSLGEEIDTNTKKPWLQVFGLDSKDQSGANNPDGKIDIDLNTLDLARGELHFRDLQPFDPVGFLIGFNDDTLYYELQNENKVAAIYSETDDSIIRRESKFYLEIETQSRGTEYNLGFNVIENSELVILNGTEMERGRDYTIDYFSGQLIMLNPAATNPSAQLDITYERNQLFQLEKKTILGMRAEYDLGKNSFFGGTILYLNESTLDNKVRVGRGPMRNIVWDFNTRLNFKPNFIGKAVDFLPIVRAKGETDLTFEGEIAQVMPTPNTLNSPKTGDDNGVAYIDDFEAAKKTVNLGVGRKNWTLASQPADNIHSYKNKLNNFIWYNPFLQVRIKDIYPERDLNANVPQVQDVLTLELYDPEDTQPDTSRWAGVMRALSPGFYDQSQTKFVEIMIQGDVGRMHLEFGTISEDVIPNGQLDTEDKKEGGIRNGVLDAGEDLGLDLVAKADPPVMNFPRRIIGADSSREAVLYDFWDVNRDGFKNADEPWSYDNWFFNSTDQYIFQNGATRNSGISSIIGSEDNANDGARIPDTEDINGNSILDAANQYFSFSFSLAEDSPDTSLIVGGNPKASGGPWKLYRIPFSVNEADFTVGSPSTSQIQFVRIWVDSLEYPLAYNNIEAFSSFARISIADINLVGSEWKEKGVTENEYDFSTGLIPPDQIGDIFAVTQINNHENPNYNIAIDEIKVSGEEDKVTGVKAREQSLVLKSINLLGESAGVAEKSLFQSESYINYDRIKMFVYGIDNNGTHITTGDSSDLEYFIRFGANENNYYEYRSKIFSGWDLARGRNEMNVKLLEFTAIDRSFKDSTQVVGDSIGIVYYDQENDIFVKKISETARVAVKGNPSFTNIRVLTLGLKNTHPLDIPYTGEVWFNELRLSDVDSDRGMAMRAKASMRIGDFGNVNVDIEKKDADFRNVATQYGTGNNSLSKNFNASVNVDKMLPQFLGIAVPVSVTYRENSSHPKYFPGRDREVTQADLDNPEILNLIETRQEQTGFNVSFRRSAQSKNFLIKNTIDNLSFNLGRSETKSANPTVAESRNTSWSGSIDYKLDFARDNFISPLSWLPNLPFIRNAKETKLYYTPQNITLRMNGNKVNTFRQNRIQNSTELADANITEDFTVDRSARMSMKIFENLSFDINRTYKAKMNDATINDFLNFNFNDINQSQSFNVRYSPQVISWIRNDFTYSANYRYNNNLQNRETGRSASNGANKSANFTVQWKQMATSLFSGGGNKKSPTRGRRPPGRSNPGEQDRNRLTIFQQEKEEGGISLNPLPLVKGFFSAFKDLQVNLSQQKNSNQAGIADSLAKPTWKYQFGLTDTTGLASIDNLSGTPITGNENQSLSLNSGLAFGRLLDIGLRFQNNTTRTDNRQISGTKSQSWLSESGFDMPFPEWTVRLSGLNKLPLVNKIFTSVNFSHGFSGQKSESWSGNENNISNQSISSNFRPLGKLDLSLKNGFTGNIQFNRSTTLTRTFSFSNGQTLPLGANRNTNVDFTLTANYSKRSGFTLPFWPFNKEGGLKNSVDFSLAFTASTVTAENKQSETADFVVSNETKRWSFQPRMTYSFSSTVRGGAFIEIGKTDSKKVGSTSIQEFGIDVNIAIRGN